MAATERDYDETSAETRDERVVGEVREFLRHYQDTGELVRLLTEPDQQRHITRLDELGDRLERLLGSVRVRADECREEAPRVASRLRVTGKCPVCSMVLSGPPGARAQEHPDASGGKSCRGVGDNLRPI